MVCEPIGLFVAERGATREGRPGGNSDRTEGRDCATTRGGSQEVSKPIDSPRLVGPVLLVTERSVAREERHEQSPESAAAGGNRSCADAGGHTTARGRAQEVSEPISSPRSVGLDLFVAGCGTTKEDRLAQAPDSAVAGGNSGLAEARDCATAHGVATARGGGHEVAESITSREDRHDQAPDSADAGGSSGRADAGGRAAARDRTQEVSKPISSPRPITKEDRPAQAPDSAVATCNSGRAEARDCATARGVTTARGGEQEVAERGATKEDRYDQAPDSAVAEGNSDSQRKIFTGCEGETGVHAITKETSGAGGSSASQRRSCAGREGEKGALAIARQTLAGASEAWSVSISCHSTASECVTTSIPGATSVGGCGAGAMSFAEPTTCGGGEVGAIALAGPTPDSRHKE